MNSPEEIRGPWPRSRVSRQIRAIEKREKERAEGPAALEPPDLAIDPLSPEDALQLWRAWFGRHGWHPYDFQEKVWARQLAGECGVISVPTGSGKTYAAIGGPLIELLQRGQRADAPAPCTLLYLTPIKALANDILNAIQTPLRELDLPFRAALRTGDLDSASRARQKKKLPSILVTTPESLALLTSEPEWQKRFSELRYVVIDEWHELLGTKRGSLLELTLSRLRDSLPALKTWVVSATLGNTHEAAIPAIGHKNFALVQDDILRETEVRAILPREPLPWFGPAGLRLKEELLAELDPTESTIVFTNTRAQAELWHRTLLEAKPEWADRLALHHGSLVREERIRVEAGVKAGDIRIVVATSSLDLGVDFPHVKKVIQIGSVKTVSRALQRSGRAEHHLGRKSRLRILPVTFFDLVETSALREAIRLGTLETKRPLPAPIDVLTQFALNSAFGDGFTLDELSRWVNGAPSYGLVKPETIEWVIEFLSGQGKVLSGYAEHRKLIEENGRYRFSSPRIARLHRLNIGTIVETSGMSVQFLSGKKLGTADEAFIARLRRGDVFQFSGRALELVQIRDMTAYVRLAKGKKAVPAVWGGQMQPVSALLAELSRREWLTPSRGSDSEREALKPLLEQQSIVSHLPAPQELLLERFSSRDGFHLFVYPFAGRAAHEGLGHLLAFRLSRLKPNTISVAANDQGLELLSTEPLPGEEEIRAAFSTENLYPDLMASLNYPELVKRAFREVARVAGLVQQSLPGLQKNVRQLQLSTGVLYDVFAQNDPTNLLLQEARRQALREHFDSTRIEAALKQMVEAKLIFRDLSRLSPFSLPLHAERVRSQVSTEDLLARVERLQRQLFGQGSNG